MILQTSLSRQTVKQLLPSQERAPIVLNYFSKCSVAAEQSLGFEKKSLPWRVLLGFCKS